MRAKPASVKVDKRGLLSKKEFGKISAMHGEAKPGEQVLEIRNVAEQQCAAAGKWPEVKKINAWMISSETATFMKVGGLGVVATELPEAFNSAFSSQGDKISVVTPLYLGDTKHKKSSLRQNIYTGAENRSVEIRKVANINVPFVGKNHVINNFKVGVYTAQRGPVEYIFLKNRRFFTITTDYRNPDCQDGCYVLNKLGVNEVERFAFFSKAVYVLLRTLCQDKAGMEKLSCPNVLIANDWHSGAIAGLTKYLTTLLQKLGRLEKKIADKIRNIPVIHLAHHLGYQGWDGKNTVRILNALYENTIRPVLKNAKACRKDNPRIHNALVVDGVYNQACCNFHLADRVVTVSRNYCEEVSKEPDFGYDFCKLLNLRKENGTFVGIVNGYDKKLITPNPKRIGGVNSHFRGFDFGCYDENSLDIKKQNKREFIRLLSKLAVDEEYRRKTLPLLNFYKFEDISDLEKASDDIPMFCATSRLVEQKGYDIAASAIVELYQSKKIKTAPIFILGGAGDMKCFEHLMKLKDTVAKINPEAAKRIFVFRGYKDEFAYAIQLASDFYMMPCRFEPCGLTQMEAMAKGSLPVAMSTGGLVDTIEDGADGFRTLVFFGNTRQVYGTEKDGKRLKNNINAYAEVLLKALDVFENNPEKLREMAVTAMRKDFSWDVKDGSVYQYYNLLTAGHL